MSLPRMDDKFYRFRCQSQNGARPLHAPTQRFPSDSILTHRSPTLSARTHSFSRSLTLLKQAAANFFRRTLDTDTIFSVINTINAIVTLWIVASILSHYIYIHYISKIDNIFWLISVKLFRIYDLSRSSILIYALLFY